MIRIIVDTASDILRDEAQAAGFDLIKIPVQFKDGEFPENSREDIRAFYEKLEHSEDFPSTSQPNFGEMVAKFEEVKAAGDQAVYLTLSSGISSTYESALKAKEIVAYDGIRVVDSLNGICSQALLAYIALDLVGQGRSLDEVVEEIERMIPYTHVLVNVDSLDYLKKGGRIPPSIAFIGNALNLKPLITFDSKGKLVSIKKDRGRKASFKSLIRLSLERVIREDYPVYVVYTSNIDLAEELRDQLLAENPLKKVELRPIGSVVGAHLGTNCVGISCMVEKKWQ